ncbi:MAG: cytochrome c oxidase subunit II [Phycisphaeraceae bacterium]|nr:cytochrome c oxidase subunit II [Phycisphaeraceae bacterium]
MDNPSISNQASLFRLLPSSSSTFAPDHDWLFYFITWVSVAAFAIVMATMIYFVIRYRRRHPDQRAQSRVSHSTGLEVTWSIIPTLIFVFIFWYGFKSFMDKANPPRDAYTITAIAWTWGWRFSYEDGAFESPELYVPRDRPVRILLTSQDVIHSLFIPDFRVKKDVVPDRLNTMWFTATEVGTFPLLCAEYCGRDHSEMLSKVHVLEDRDFRQWLSEERQAADMLPPLELGERLYVNLGCASCHSIDGSSISGGGPSFLNIFRYERPLRTGEAVMADEEYLRRSILEPGAEVTAGYNNIMPSYAGQVNERQLAALVAFVKAQSDRLTAEELEALKRLPEEDEESDEDAADEEAGDEQAQPAEVD